MSNQSNKRQYSLRQYLLTFLVLVLQNEIYAAPGGSLLKLLPKAKYSSSMQIPLMSKSGRRAYTEFSDSASFLENEGGYYNSNKYLYIQLERFGNTYEKVVLNESTNLMSGVNVANKTGNVTQYALFIPRLKEQHIITKIENGQGIRIIRGYQSHISGKVKIEQDINFEKINGKYYKSISRVAIESENTNSMALAIKMSDDKGRDSIHISQQKDGNDLRGNFNLPKDIKGEITQININRDGTRLSFITSEGNQYKYIIHKNNNGDRHDSFTFEQDMTGVDPRFPEKGIPIPKQQLNEVLYADVKVYPGVKNVKESTAAQIDIAPAPAPAEASKTIE